jgi:hypothetical protein
VITPFQNGETVDTVVSRSFPNITRAQVYECLAYYEDYRGEIDVPDDAAFSLEAMGHVVVKLREVLSVTTPDEEAPVAWTKLVPRKFPVRQGTA